MYTLNTTHSSPKRETTPDFLKKGTDYPAGVKPPRNMVLTPSKTSHSPASRENLKSKAELPDLQNAVSAYAFDDSKIELLEVDDKPAKQVKNYRLYRHVTLIGYISHPDANTRLDGIEIDVEFFALTHANPARQTVRTEANGYFIAHAVVMYSQAINCIDTRCSTGATAKFSNPSHFGDHTLQIANFCRSEHTSAAKAHREWRAKS